MDSLRNMNCHKYDGVKENEDDNNRCNNDLLRKFLITKLDINYIDEYYHYNRKKQIEKDNI